MSKRIKRPQKVPVLIFCEGKSEKSYIKYLHLLANSAGVHYSFNPEDCGGGNIFSLLDEAKRRLKKIKRTGVKYKYKFLILDTDINQQHEAHYDQGIRLAAKLGITLIWQEEDHEGFLLRHFGDYGKHNHTKMRVRTLLARNIPSYVKGMDANKLKKVLMLPNVKYASDNINSYMAFFNEIEWKI